MRGKKLSGGQKQRVSTARVFLKNPPIVILGEATSSLDNESEKLVQASLDELAVGRKTLTIARRMTTIKKASLMVERRSGLEERQKRPICADDLSEEPQPGYHFC